MDFGKLTDIADLALTDLRSGDDHHSVVGLVMVAVTVDDGQMAIHTISSMPRDLTDTIVHQLRDGDWGRAEKRRVHRQSKRKTP